MRFVCIAALLMLAGCTNLQERRRSEYHAVVERWETAYSGADAAVAYAETLVYAEYLKKMQSSDAPADAAKVLVWIYPRLGLLAEHLGKKEEAEEYFSMAVRHARAVHPSEPESKSTEEAFRSGLNQMDTPNKVLWRKAPNQPSQPTPTSRRG